MAEIKETSESSEVSEGGDSSVATETSSEVEGANSSELESPDEGNESSELDSDEESEGDDSSEEPETDSENETGDESENDAPLEPDNQDDISDAPQGEEGEKPEGSNEDAEASGENLDSSREQELEDPGEGENSEHQETSEETDTVNEAEGVTEDTPENKEDTSDNGEDKPEGEDGDEEPDGGDEEPDGGDEEPDGGEDEPEGEDSDEEPEGGEEEPDGGEDKPEGEDGDEEPEGSEGNADDGAETPVEDQQDLRDEPLDAEEKPSLQYGETEHPEYDPEKSDLQNAQEDLDFAREQQEAYQRSVDAGEVVDDPAVRQQLNDSVTQAESHLDDVKNGQPYSYDKPSDYWSSPEGRKLSGDIFTHGTNFAVNQASDKLVGASPKSDPSVASAAKNFGRYYGENYGYKHIGQAADGAQSMMRNVHDQNETPSDRYMQEHFLRDENGNPLTASEGREAAFANDAPEKTERTDAPWDNSASVMENSDLRENPLENAGEMNDNPAEDTPSHGLEKVKADEEAKIGKDVGEMPDDVNNKIDGNFKENVEPDAGKNEASTLENVDNKALISNETRECLGDFEQEKWDNMSQFEKEESILKLRDSIANDLNIQNKPDIVYYRDPDPTDFGGYAASTNTIYINRLNIGDAKETADTVAHESRHCWQHERAENPQNEQDQRFKENFENYVSPDDDFDAYQKQPVEADARSYGEAVISQIPESGSASEVDGSYKTESVTSENESSRAPPSEVNQKANNSDVETQPNKNDADTQAIEFKAPVDLTPTDLTPKKVEKVVETNEIVPVSEDVKKSLEGSGLTDEKIQSIREQPKPDYSNSETKDGDSFKPDPKTYLSAEYIENHLKPFETTGCFRIQENDPTDPNDQYGGVLGHESGLFVTSGADIKKALEESGGDVRNLEQVLGLKEYALGENPVIVSIDNPVNIRMPSGNEMAASPKYFIPGGFTSGNIAEAVIDSVPNGGYKVIPLNSPNVIDWVDKKGNV